MVINTEGNLKDHIQNMWQKSNKILATDKCNRNKESGANRRN